MPRNNAHKAWMLTVEQPKKSALFHLNRRKRKYMKMIKKILERGLLAGMILGMAAFPADISAAAQDSLSSVTEEAQIQPIRDGSGKYLMKSNGFYCLDVSGARENKAAVHYFDAYEIDGTIFDGYYYHDAEGRFKAGDAQMVHLKGVPIAVMQEDSTLTETVIADGFYMVNNLGKLSAAPQVRYFDNLVMDGVTFNGYYYFNEEGRLVTEPGIHFVDLLCNGRKFSGSYYFGGANGSLVQESTVTADGFMVDDTGKVSNLEQLGVENLEPVLTELLSGYDGEWSVYVKDLNTEQSLLINDRPYYSASLIKAFVMAKSYSNMEMLKENETVRLKNAAPETVRVKLEDLLWNMITVSDNESSNELVRLQTGSHDFLEGAKQVNKYLEAEGYGDTSVQHTLHPSASDSVGLGGRNMTSVKDCGLLLERIYKGKCVSEEASRAMLNLLLNQQVTWKIPEGLPAGIVSGNKTGETDEDQHDIAIVYGEKTTYILCVMSEGFANEDTAVRNIRSISKVVYNYLNL